MRGGGIDGLKEGERLGCLGKGGEGNQGDGIGVGRWWGKGSTDLEKHIFVDERLSRAMRVEGIWLEIHRMDRSDRGGYKEVGFLD